MDATTKQAPEGSNGADGNVMTPTTNNRYGSDHKKSQKWASPVGCAHETEG